MTTPDEALTRLRDQAARVRAELHKVVVGQDDALGWMLAAVFLRGHVLLEGVPGTAKTLMVRALARALGASSRRIQFTPDLMPSDILGTSVYNVASGAFTLRQGPIFTELLLADEINRTPAKTQAALLEAMQERSVTIDGQTHKLPDLFTVFATQNPIEMEGTYALPEAQTDRFLFKILLTYPEAPQEEEILRAYHAGRTPHDVDRSDIRPVLAAGEALEAKAAIDQVGVSDGVISYIRRVVSATRESGDVILGCGPRAGIALLLASKALAGLGGRNFVTPDDVKEAALPVLRHRLILNPEAEVEGLRTDDLLRRILGKVEVPR